MSITFQQTEGSNGTNRAITAIAGNEIKVGTGLGATVNVGDIASINGSTTNDGNYTILTLVSGGTNPTVFTVRPTPNATVSGSIRKLNKNAVLQTSTNVTSVVIDTLDASLAYIQASGATFRTFRVQRGDRVAVEGSSTTANNGAWIVHAVISETVVCVRTPDGGTGMTAQANVGTLTVRAGRIMLDILNENPVIATATSGVMYTFDQSDKTITRPSGSWITDGFQPGHRVTLISGVLNTGVIPIPIKSVTALTLTFMDESTTLVDETLSGVSITVRGLTWAYIQANGVPKTAPANVFGSGAMRDYIRLQGLSTTDEVRTLVLLEGISRITLDQTGMNLESSWYMFNEVVVASCATSSPQCVVLNAGSWSGENCSVFFGHRPGDRYSASKGSAMIGLQWFQQSTVVNTMYGSYYDGTSTNIYSANGEICSSLIRGRVNFGAGLAESVVAYGETGVGGGGMGFEAVADQANLLLANQGAGGAAIAVASVVGGLLVADVVPQPAFFFNGTGVFEVRDPRVDYDLTDLVSNLTATSMKTYSFVPRFVSNDGQNNPQIVGLNLLTITIHEIRESDGDENVIIPFDHVQTDANGFPDTVGTQLRRQTTDALDIQELYSHRITLEGGGYKQQQAAIIQMVSPRIGDWNVQRIVPDFEGEYNE